jgi:hypothetical protein
MTSRLPLRPGDDPRQVAAVLRELIGEAGRLAGQGPAALGYRDRYLAWVEHVGMQLGDWSEDGELALKLQSESHRRIRELNDMSPRP